MLVIKLLMVSNRRRMRMKNKELFFWYDDSVRILNFEYRTT